MLSKPTDWSGGRNLIIILDMSDSTFLKSIKSATGTEITEGTDKTPHEIIVANALYILEDPDLRDANLGVIAFGTDAIEVSDGLYTSVIRNT
ncbi:MAG: hypothetical protein R2741_01505 [Methanolobus sp.]